LTLAFNIRPVKATGTIYIRADGSIDPPTAPIQRDGDLYTLTGKIITDYVGIVIQRNDMILDGAAYAVQGVRTPGIWQGSGIYILGRSNATIRNIELKSLMDGIVLEGSSNIKIYRAKIDDNAYSIKLINSTSNNLLGNNLENSDWGYDIHLLDSSNNSIYHNNFFGNVSHAYLLGQYANSWDDGYPSGGNYWSHYTGVDIDDDGIGDTARIIDANNTDRYPLMGMFSDFNATSEYHVQTICNSSMSDFQSNGTSIRFNVTGEDGTAGFCRICIPTALINATYRVFVNGTEVQCNLLPCSNSTQSYLYFTYSHSTKEMVIIPELASLIILPFFMIATLLAVIVHRKRGIKNRKTSSN
jgi:parallel beta-helix repeat protein